jgi:DNA-directed RNA polymerase specialized sigma24 family protein
VALDDFRGESSPYTFAYRVAINTCCNYVGKEKHESKQSLGFDIDMVGVKFTYEAMVDYKIMIEFASTFKRIDREIIFMYLLGEKQSFIAEVLGLSETNVSSKLNRLKHTIETHMNKGMPDEK